VRPLSLNDVDPVPAFNAAPPLRLARPMTITVSSAIDVGEMERWLKVFSDEARRRLHLIVGAHGVDVPLWL
jgi:hypothetical protein